MRPRSFRIRDGLYLVGSGPVGLTHPLDCNVYLIVRKNQCALIDSGCGIRARQLVGNLHSLGITQLRYIFLTHGHADHSMGVPALLRFYQPEAIVLDEEERTALVTADAHALGLTRAKRSGTYPPHYELVPYGRDWSWSPATHSFDIGDWMLTPIPTPGHSSGSVCYLLEGRGFRGLFSGDTVFLGGYISYGNLPGASLEQYHRSLDRLLEAEPTELYPGHGLWAVGRVAEYLKRARRGLERSRLPGMFPRPVAP